MYIRASALPNSFLLTSLFRESTWYVGGFSALYFGNSCFVTDWVVTFLLYTETGTRTNCSLSRQMFIDWRCNDCYSMQSFSENRTFLFCFQVVLFNNSNQTSSRNFTTSCLSMVCKFPLSRFTMHSHRKRINSFGQD